MYNTLPRDDSGAEIQGFRPVDILAGSLTAIDVSDYVAFRVSGDTDVQYTIGGVLTTNAASLSKGTITVCDSIDSITCGTAVNIEVM